MHKRYLFALHDALGWRTLAERLRRSLPDQNVAWKVVQLKATAMQWRLMWQPNVSHYGRWHVPLFDSFEVFKLVTARLAKEASRYDAVFTATQSMAAGLLRNKVSVPIVTLIDATRPVIQRDFGATNVSRKRIDAEREVFQQVAHIFSLSQWAASSVVNDCGIGQCKVTLLLPFVPLGVPLAQKTAPPGKLKAIFIGGDFNRKGGADLLRWYRRILHKYISLHIVTQRRFHIDVPGVAWHFDIGNDALLTTLLPTMDVHCHPTKQDMSAIVVAEAAANGIPSIATRVGGIGDLIEDGVTGFLVENGDEGGFIEKVAEIYHKREILNRMSLAAHQKAAKEFSQKQAIASIISVLNRVS